MANELKHKDVGEELTKAEWEGVDTHQLDSQAAGDIIYASSTTQLSRLAKGDDGQVLTLASGVPSWATSTGLTVSETEVFSGTSPTSWTDLDLSGTVGSNAALVFLKFGSAAAMGAVAVRKNGDTDEFYSATAEEYGSGASLFHTTANVFMTLLVATDTSGVIEWITENAQTATVDIIAYIK